MDWLKFGGQRFKVAVTVTQEFIRKMSQMFVPNLKKFPQGVPEILCSKKCDGQKDGQPENIKPPATAVAGAET